MTMMDRWTDDDARSERSGIRTARVSRSRRGGDLPDLIIEG